MVSKQTKYLLFLVTFCIILLAPTASAVPPQQTSDTTLDLESAYPSTLKLGEDFYIHTHVYDTVDEVLVTTGASCYYHFYNHQINGGEHISTGNLTQYGVGYNATIDGSLINESGEYSALIWCNISAPADRIGYNRYTMDATPTGDIPSTADGILVFLAILVMFLVAGMLLTLAFRMSKGTFILIFYSLATIIFFMATLFSMTLIDNILPQFEFIVNGYTAFVMVFKILLSMGVLAITLYAGLRALKMYRIKRGYEDED